MASSDDEFEILPYIVSDFHFEDEYGEPISFSALPLQWGEDDFLYGMKTKIFLSGVVDDGLQKFFKPVTAWKFSLLEAVPQIFTLFKEKNWIKLHKPKKGYGDEIRSILITIHSLHFLRRNPEASKNSLWDHLAKIFSAYDVRPSQDDLMDHMLLISKVVNRDELLGKCKFLLSFLEEKTPPKSEFSKVIEISTKPAFIVDVDDEMDDAEMDAVEDGSDEEDDFFGSICAICDNGGELICCDGQCMRSFHATKVAGVESGCRSLGFTNAAQVRAVQSFICRNCQYNRHQCFCCGKLGSSDKASGAEVFRCVNATCGLFYHPHCVAKVLHHDAASVEEMQAKIAAGESFTCPIHRCFVCQKLEDKNDHELQFALCRRCPKSYHRKCLPSDISFEADEDEGIIQRAWEDLLPKRILLYCLDHEIDEALATPIRNHIKFPALPEDKKKQDSSFLSDRKKFRLKKNLDSEELAMEKSSRKPYYQKLKQSSPLAKADSLKIKGERLLPISSNKVKPLHGSLKCKKLKSSTIGENEISLGNQLYDFWTKGSEPSKPKKQNITAVASEKTVPAMPLKGALTNAYQLDMDSERRILDMMKQATSSITLDDILKKQKLPSIYVSKNFDIKSITHGKIEGSVQAVRAAVDKLEKGGSIEDAKAVCEPAILQQIARWKNRLQVYLAPFIHGVRYTSFGRHFTKVDKLKEIVDRLHWYVRNGDTIVDFCCGANDFSCLMKSKLEETGKKCLYMNFDLLQPKHDFNFVKKDWFTVDINELPTGSKLIIGLNPPFGVKGSLANLFVEKALTFKPKLVILIVPPETERLDQKRSHYPRYDLVWEDSSKLSGKSFYLPGSVDIHDKQMEQWNTTPPRLSLWSRSDWTQTHIAIASSNNHLSHPQTEPQLQQSPTRKLPPPPPPPPVPVWSPDDKCDNDCDVMMDLQPDPPTRPSQSKQLDAESSRQLDAKFSSVEKQVLFEPRSSQSYSHFNPGLPFGSGYSAARTPTPELPIWGNQEHYSGIEEHYSGETARWRTESGGTHYGTIDSDILTRVQRYGQQEPAGGMGYMERHNLLPAVPSPYGHLSMPVESSFNKSSGSAIHRYAPRLDELNHVRTEGPMARGQRPIYRGGFTGFPRHPFPYNG